MAVNGVNLKIGGKILRDKDLVQLTDRMYFTIH